MTSNDPAEVLEQSEGGIGMCRLHATVCDLGASQGELITVGGQAEIVADQDFRKQETQFTGHLLANLADPLDQAMALGQAQQPTAQFECQRFDEGTGASLGVGERFAGGGCGWRCATVRSVRGGAVGRVEASPSANQCHAADQADSGESDEWHGGQAGQGQHDQESRCQEQHLGLAEELLHDRAGQVAIARGAGHDQSGGQ